MASQAYYRTEQKLRYAQIHLEELTAYSNATSNDEWENAHQESFLYHLASAVEAILLEINDGYSLSLPLQDITWRRIRSQLAETGQLSHAFNRVDSMRNDPTSWLSLLFEWRNHGTHRSRVGKQINVSTWQILDNEFIDPRSRLLQTVYPGLGCGDVLAHLLKDVRALINECRTMDSKLSLRTTTD